MSAYAVSSRGLAAHKLPQGTLATIMEMLYANGELGIAKLDFSDFTGMYQDRARTIPYTAVEQPLGSFTGLNGVTATAHADVNRGKVSARVNLLNDVATLATQSVTVAAGNYVLSFSGAGSVTLSGAATGVKGAGDNAITCTAGILTLTVSGAVNDGFLRTASNLHLPFQWVNSPSDYDTGGFPHRLVFNGTNTSYVTPSIDFSGTDKMTVWAGWGTLGAVDQMRIVELGADASSLKGFAVVGAIVTSARVRGELFGTSRGVVDSPAYPYPANTVASVQYDIGASALLDEIKIRANGAVVNSPTLDSAGTGTFQSAAINIGARNGVGNFFNGNLYSLIVRGAQSSLSQIEAVENLIRKTMRLP